MFSNHDGIKPETNSKRNFRNYINTQRMNTCLHKQRVIEEVRMDKFLETNENGNTTCQNLWHTAKAVL
jgi:hypothetical protein